MPLGPAKALMPTRRSLIVWAAALGYGIFAGQKDAGLTANPDDAAQVAQGRQVYASQCASCHGGRLPGQPNWRQRQPNGRLPAPPHDETGHTWHHPDDLLFALTKEGPAALTRSAYQSDMPAFAGKLSDQDIWAVLAFIKSRWPKGVRERQAAITHRAQKK